MHRFNCTRVKKNPNRLPVFKCRAIGQWKIIYLKVYLKTYEWEVKKTESHFKFALLKTSHNKSAIFSFYISFWIFF
jgi:hypothetical protein